MKFSEKIIKLRKQRRKSKMAKFCTKCGAELKEGEVHVCSANQQINAVEQAAAIASSASLEEYKSMEFIDEFNAAVQELGDERFNRYCELAYRHAAARGTDEWYDLYKDFMVAVKGWWGYTVRRVVVVRFENGDTPIRKVITER